MDDTQAQLIELRTPHSLWIARGYWNAQVFFDLLEKGADVHGTIKRMDWVSLSYSKQKKDANPTSADGSKDGSKIFPDSPLQMIPMAGYKDSYHMSLDWKGTKSMNQKVDMFGYRSGSGSAVSIIASSVFRKDHYDSHFWESRVIMDNRKKYHE